MPQKQNIEMLTLVAKRLGPMKESFAFLGGAVTGLLITDQAAPDARSTRDIDVIVEVATRSDYYAIGKKLEKLGFRIDSSEGAPICRWSVEGIKIDVMPTKTSILGFSNHWYKETILHAQKFKLAGETEILLATAPYFLATKLEAFYGRGEGDFLASHDMEDIISLIDGRPELSDEVNNSSKKIRRFLSDIFSEFLTNDLFLECISGHLPPDFASQARKKIVLERIRRIANYQEGLSQAGL